MTIGTLPTITLTIERPGRAPETVTLSGPRVLVGRETGDIVLADPESSALHAELEIAAGHVIVRDLGSSNGTWRDGKRLPQFALLAGQSFRVGATILTLTRLGDAPPLVPGRTLLSTQTQASSVTLPGPAASSTATTPATPAASSRTFRGFPQPRPPFPTASVDAAASSVEAPIPQLGQDAPVLARDSVVPVTPPESAMPSSTLRAPIVDETVDRTAIGPSPAQIAAAMTSNPDGTRPPMLPDASAAAATPSRAPMRAPVANALIKPGARPLTGPIATVAASPRLPRAWGKFLRIGALTTVVIAALGVGTWAITRWLRDRAPALAEIAAAELPPDTLGFVAIASPRTQLRLMGDNVPEAFRANGTAELGFDPWSLSAWEERGIDVDAPIAISLLDLSRPSFALSLGIHDVDKFRAALPALLAKSMRAESVTVIDRSFGSTAGLWAESPHPVAVLPRNKRALIVFAQAADPAAVARQAERIAGIVSGDSLADRPGFTELVGEPGEALVFAYADGVSMRAAIPVGGAELLALQLAFREVDGLAMTVSSDQARISLGWQTVIREGSETARYVGERELSGRAFDRIPGPALAGLHLVVGAEPIAQTLIGFATLSGVWSRVEEDFKADSGLDLRGDVIDNIGGELGAALLRLPSKPQAEDAAGVVFIGVKDDGKATASLAKAIPTIQKLIDAPGSTSEAIGAVTVHRFGGKIPVSVFVTEGFLWIVAGTADVNALVQSSGTSIRTSARTPAIADAVASGGSVAGFFDIKETVSASDPLLSEGERKRRGELERVLAPLDVFTLRGGLSGRNATVRLTLHTTVDDAARTLVTALLDSAGEELAQELARTRRREGCDALVEKLVEMGKTDKSRTFAEFEIRFEFRDRCVATADPTALACAAAAQNFAEISACGGSLLPEESDPLPVPYIDDIWPHTKAEGASDGKPLPDVNYAVGIGSDPQTRGRADALVTIVEFGGFACPYCRRVTGTLDQVLAKYDGEVRLVFRHNPLAMHTQGKPAARAALAAARQGKFWAMHDKLFEQAELGDASYGPLAEELGLDRAQFDRDMLDPLLDARIAEDIAAAERFGVSGTPTFFVNGRILSGAQPIEAFDHLITAELERARRFVERRGSTRKGLYDDIVARFAPEVGKPSAPLPVDTGERFAIDTSGLPRRGSDGFAGVSIIECGDFDCPFCQRVTKALTRVLAEHPRDVALYFVHMPLAHHPTAEQAARAAVAAGAQGKFWEMHDKLYDNPDARKDADFEAFARELKLDVDAFKAAMSDPATAKVVADGRKVCGDNGATGTPTFFVNGRRVEGAIPFESFKALIEASLSVGI